jgi:hypothetical protein
MNERLLELARQVWPDPNISHTNHMKFAELLIRECMDIVCDINQEYDGGSTVVNAAEEIREYFGVK